MFKLVNIIMLIMDSHWIIIWLNKVFELRNWLVLCTILIIITLIIYSLRLWIRTVRLAFCLPGPPAVPIFGNIFLVKDSKLLLKFANVAVQNYGKLFRGWLTIIPMFIVVDPKHIQLILGSTKLTDKNFLYSLMHTFIGRGLITNNGYKWKSHRKSIQPYFRLKNLEIFVPMFLEAAQLMVENLKASNSVKITTHINNCIVDVLHLTILGIPLSEKEITKNSPIASGSMVLLERIMKPWLLLNLLYKFTQNAKRETKQKYSLREFIQLILEQRKLDKMKNRFTYNCLLEILMEISEDNKEFTDEDIVNETCTFLLAGQDSVGSATAFTLYYLAKHQEIQKKVVEEINTVILDSEPVNINNLNNLKYLEQCIKETMRIFPSIPLIARKLSEDVKLDNWVIPNGSNIFISPYLTHRLTEYYPNPEDFDPERFSSDTQTNLNPFAYIPFSAGPRNCIGYKFAMLEMKTIILTILKKYQILLDSNYELNIYFRVAMRSRGGVTLNLITR